jgi:hypothetical protein
VSVIAIHPAAVVREAHAVLHVAMEAPACEVTEAAIVRLGDALETYAELDSRALSWEWVYPELIGEGDPDDAALRKAADEVDAVTDDLIKVMAAHCGTENEMTIPGVGK